MIPTAAYAGTGVWVPPQRPPDRAPEAVAVVVGRGTGGGGGWAFVVGARRGGIRRR